MLMEIGQRRNVTLTKTYTACLSIIGANFILLRILLVYTYREAMQFGMFFICSEKLCNSDFTLNR